MLNACSTSCFHVMVSVLSISVLSAKSSLLPSDKMASKASMPVCVRRMRFEAASEISINPR